MKKINLEKFSEEIKKYDIKSFLDTAPRKLKNDFKMLKILCYVLNNDLDPNNLSRVELAKEYQISDTTVSRLFSKKYDIHKKLWNFALKTDVCKLQKDEEKFAYFMINFVLKNLSLHTIKKNKIFNYFYKIGVNLGLFEYKSLYSDKKDTKDINKIKEELNKVFDEVSKKYFKSDKHKKIKKQMDKIQNDFKNKSKEEQLKILSETEKSIKRKRKIKILANIDSSETIKKLARDFGCEIKNKTNIIKKYERLTY